MLYLESTCNIIGLTVSNFRKILDKIQAFKAIGSFLLSTYQEQNFKWR